MGSNARRRPPRPGETPGRSPLPAPRPPSRTPRARSRSAGHPPAPTPLVALTALGGLIAGLACSYPFSGSSVPSHIKTIAVPTFRNETLQPGLERELTNAVIDVFLDDNRLNIGGMGNADAVVEGRVLQYDHSVFGIGNTDQAQEYRVTIKLAVVVKDRVKGKDLWSKDAMVAQSNYRVDAAAGNRASETEARADAVRKLAEDVLANTLEEW